MRYGEWNIKWYSKMLLFPVEGGLAWVFFWCKICEKLLHLKNPLQQQLDYCLKTLNGNLFISFDLLNLIFPTPWTNIFRTHPKALYECMEELM